MAAGNIQDFRLEKDVGRALSEGCYEIYSGEELEKFPPASFNASPDTLLSAPYVLHGRGQKNCYKFVWYGSHLRIFCAPQRNIIFHHSGNKGPARFITTALESLQLFLTN